MPIFKKIACVCQRTSVLEIPNGFEQPKVADRSEMHLSCMGHSMWAEIIINVSPKVTFFDFSFRRNYFFLLILEFIQPKCGMMRINHSH